MSTSNKQLALDFFSMIIAGKIDEAYATYVDMNGKQHNAYTAAGFANLRDGMKENDLQFPNKKMEVKHVLADGDLVALHSHVVLDPGKTEVAVVHIVRIDGEKIVEMWDCGQPMPTEEKNTDGMF